MPTRPTVLWLLEPASAQHMVRAIVELDLAGADAVVLPAESRGGPEPLLVAAAAAHRAPRIGLIAEISPWSQPPFLTARALNTLDALTRGRAGWFVGAEDTGAVCVDDSGRWSPDEAGAREREEALADYLAATAALWNSWEPHAIVADVAAGRYVDADCVHVPGYRGPYYATRGPLNAPRPPQGRPVRVAEFVSAAAGSGILGTAASDTADVVLVERESEVAAAAETASHVLLRLGPGQALSPPETAADGYAFHGIGPGAMFGRVLHEVLPALAAARGGLLRDRLALPASDFDFVPCEPGTEVHL
ncbi:LLM class flavin-dependent oxidoreductase [Nocardia higoensis]|uniref:LLM class flavin-dependent oxidoreductase n=1 Tax=Nocardia higoensis TaxID=228599 RepID=UPI0002FA070B|nr:LLM class flavin-dependent oxidoreductase [Nocardia higoensis]